MKKRKISPTELHDLLLTAAETERCLPPAIKKAKGSWWLDVLPEWSAYGYTQENDSAHTHNKHRASPKDIDDFDFVLTVIASMSDIEERHILWATAKSAAYRKKPQWTKVAKRFHTNRRALKNRYERIVILTARDWSRAVSQSLAS